MWIIKGKIFQKQCRFHENRAHFFRAIAATRSLILMHIESVKAWFFLCPEKCAAPIFFLSIWNLFYFRKPLMLQQFFAFESIWDCLTPAEGIIKFVLTILWILFSNIRSLHVFLTSCQWNHLVYFHLYRFCQDRVQ